MNQRTKQLIAILIFLVGGIVFIVMGISNMSHTKNFSKVDVLVTQIETSPSTDIEEPDDEIIYVSYTVDGKEYNEILQFAPSNISEGETLSVLYDPNDPSYVTGANSKNAMIYIGLGALFGIGALLALFRSLATGR